MTGESKVHTRPHVLVVPFPQSGHMLPHLDLTHQLLLRGITATVVVTPKNLHYLNPLLSLHSRETLKTLTLPFPPHNSIPEGVESLQQLPLQSLPHMFDALSGLRNPLIDWLRDLKPSDRPIAVLGSSFLSPWINTVADEFGIKSICFLPINAHSVSIIWADEDKAFFEDLVRCTSESYGLVVNSFYELEAEFVEVVKDKYMKNHRVWTVGPLPATKAGLDRGGPSSFPAQKVMEWLDSCQGDNSVVYVGFGSQIRLTKEQTAALAAGLEKSGVRFIWAIRDPAKEVKSVGGETEIDDNGVPEGFEARVSDKGLIIRGWAPQSMILEHRAVGSYLTHLGWGSVLEGILGGVFLLAWPMQADHFYNTKLLVDKMGVAVRVAENKESVPDPEKLALVLADSVNGNLPERAHYMKLREKGLIAIKEGGSSYTNLDELASEFARFQTEKDRK